MPESRTRFNKARPTRRISNQKPQGYDERRHLSPQKSVLESPQTRRLKKRTGEAGVEFRTAWKTSSPRSSCVQPLTFALNRSSSLDRTAITGCWLEHIIKTTSDLVHICTWTASLFKSHFLALYLDIGEGEP